MGRRKLQLCLHAALPEDVLQLHIGGHGEKVLSHPFQEQLEILASQKDLSVSKERNLLFTRQLETSSALKITTLLTVAKPSLTR